MAAKSSTVTVQILADNSQYKREMNETAQVTDKAGKKMGDSTDGVGKKMSAFGKVAVAALAVTAVAAVGKFVGDSLRAFSDLNESLNALEVTYGEHAEGIKQLGEESAQNLGLSNAEFNTFAVSLSAFAQQIAGDSGDVVGTVDTLTQRVSDFASVMNIDVAEAAEKFRSGLAGEAEPLRIFGIDVSAATVETVALAEGIWDGTGAMTESQKVQGRYAAIMDQTSKVQGDFANTADEAANKQRILDAELENTKALLGRSILPLQTQWQEIQAAAIPIIADLAIELGRFTGALSDAEAALLKFESKEGEAVTTADQLLTAISSLGSGSPLADWVGGLFNMTAKTDDWVAAMEEGITTSGLEEEELYRLGLAFEDLNEKGDLTDAQLLTLNHTLEVQKYHQEQLVRPIGDNERALYGMADAETALDDATEETTEEIERQSDLLRALTDPIFNAMEATRNLETAQTDYDAILKNSESTIAEQEAALADLWDAQINLISSQEDLEAMGPDWQQEFRDRGLAMGFPLEEINKIIARVEYLNALAQEGIEIRVDYRAGTEPNLRGGARASGGPVQGGRPYLVGERGPELMVPSGSGTVIPNNRLGSAGGVNIYLTVNALDPNTAARAVVEALQTYNRTNGALPITVRTA